MRKRRKVKLQSLWVCHKENMATKHKKDNSFETRTLWEKRKLDEDQTRNMLFHGINI